LSSSAFEQTVGKRGRGKGGIRQNCTPFKAAHRHRERSRTNESEREREGTREREAVAKRGGGERCREDNEREKETEHSEDGVRGWARRAANLWGGEKKTRSERQTHPPTQVSGAISTALSVGGGANRHMEEGGGARPPIREAAADSATLPDTPDQSAPQSVAYAIAIMTDHIRVSARHTAQSQIRPISLQCGSGRIGSNRIGSDWRGSDRVVGSGPVHSALVQPQSRAEQSRAAVWRSASSSISWPLLHAERQCRRHTCICRRQ
jgi:hypothetical protein